MKTNRLALESSHSFGYCPQKCCTRSKVQKDPSFPTFCVAATDRNWGLEILLSPSTVQSGSPILRRDTDAVDRTANTARGNIVCFELVPLFLIKRPATVRSALRISSYAFNSWRSRACVHSFQIHDCRQHQAILAPIVCWTQREGNAKREDE